ADVVANVVGVNRGIAGIVLRDAGLDLADEVGADVGGLRVDAAAETREDGDQGAAEGEADEIVDRGFRRVVDPPREHPVVAGDAQQPEPDDEETGHGPGTERDLERRLDALPGSLRRPYVRAHGDVHADEPGRRRQDRTYQDLARRPHAEPDVESAKV